VNSAAGVIHAALKQCQTPAGIALALESAGLLMSPEAAKDIASVSTDAVRVAENAVAELKREHEEAARLRLRIAELKAERHTTNDALAAVTVALRENAPARENLGAWLYEQFVPSANPASWDRLPKADQAYWEQRAVIVRRAVARDGTR
jgi:hypothetical protein